MYNIYKTIFSTVLLWIIFQNVRAQTVINFNSVTNFTGYGLTYTEGGFNFSINDPGGGKQITGNVGMGYQGTGCLYDNNLTVGAINRWTIRKADNSAFQFRGIFLKAALTGSSTSGTITGYRNGSSTGTVSNVSFSPTATAPLDFSSNPIFFNVDEIRIEAADINFYLDHFTYSSPSGVINSAPQVTGVSTTPTVMEDAATTLNGMSVSDVDGDNQILSFNVTGGTLTLGSAGITFGGSGNGSSNFTASGSLANLNNALGTATFTPSANLFGTNAGGVSFSANDGTANSSPASFTFDINGVNDDPTVTGLPSQITLEEDSNPVIDPSADTFDITSSMIGDIDAGTGELDLILNATGGVLDVAAGTGITLSGNLTDQLIVRGNLTDLNNYIHINSNIYFRPDANLSGVNAGSVDVYIKDNGNTGSGGGGTIHAGTIALHITPVNDAPTVANPIPDQNADSGTSFNFQFLTNTFNDPDPGDVLTYSAQLNGGGALPAWLNFDAGTRTFSGTPGNADTGVLTIEVTASDGNGGIVTDEFILNVSASNDAPVFDRNGAPNILWTEGDPPSIINPVLLVSDVDGDNLIKATVRILPSHPGDELTVESPSPFAATYDPGTAILTLEGTGTPAQMQAALRTVGYHNSSDDPGLGGTANTRIFSFFVTDENGATSASVTNIGVFIVSVNDGPRIVSLPSTVTVVENSISPIEIGATSFEDEDAGSGSMTVNLVVASGSLTATSAGGVTVSGSGTNSLSLEGTLSSVNSFFDGNNVGFLNQSGNSTDQILTVTIIDNENTGTGGSLTASGTVTIIVEPPVLPLASDVAVQGSLIEGEQLTGQYTYSHAEGDPESGSVYQWYRSDDASGTNKMVIAGAGSATYLLSSDDVGKYISFEVTPSNGTEMGAAVESQVAGPVIEEANSAPEITAPVSINIVEDVPATLTGISFSDADAGSNPVTVRLYVGIGSLSATSGGGVTVSGSSNTVILDGSIPDINAFIASGGVIYTTAENSTQNLAFGINIDDNGNTGSGGSKTDGLLITIVVQAVNDPPVISMPSIQSIDQNSVLILSSGSGNLISITDVDVGSNPLEVTLTANNGLVTLANTSGLSFTSGSGTGDNLMTFTGTQSNINTALNGMSFTPSAGYNGPASLSVAVNDQGWSGSGGAQSATETLQISVDATNPIVTEVSSASPDDLYKIGDVLTLLVSFDQSVIVNSSSGTPSLNLATGMIEQNAIYQSGSGTNVLTFSYTVLEGGLSSDLDYTSTSALSLNGATIQNLNGDDAILSLPGTGTANSLAGRADLRIDGVRPTVSIDLSPNELSSGETSLVTFNFSEAVLGVDNEDLTIPNGTLSPLGSTDGGTTWTATFTPDSDIEDGANVITINNSGFTDIAGNIGTGATESEHYVIDTKVPTVTISLSDIALIIGETATVEFNFSEPVSGFSNADLSIANGTLTDVSSEDAGLTWTAVFTPTAGTELANNVITVDNSGYQDAAGNPGTGTTSSDNYLIDNVAPTVTTQSLTVYLDNTGSASVTPEQIDNNSSDGFSIASLSLSQTDFGCSHVGDNTIKLTVTDVNGNAASANATVTVVDNTGPMVKTKNITVSLAPVGTITVPAEEVDNGSSDICGVASFSLDKQVFGPSDIGDNPVVLTVIDIHGNSSTGAATVTVVPIEITGLTFEDASFVYDGTPKSLTVSGTLPEGTSVLYSANSRTNTGSQEVTATVSGANYTTLVLTADLTISPAALTITANPGQSKLYGEADPTLTYSQSGLIGSDVLSGSLTREAGENAGEYAINQGTLTAGGNYAISYQSNNFQIAKAPLYIQANDKAVCQGEDPGTFSFSYSGFRFNDNAESLIKKPVLDQTPGTAQAGQYSLVATGAEAANYELNYSDGIFTVYPAPQVSIRSDKGLEISKGETLTLTATGGTNYSWSGMDILSGQSSSQVTIRPFESGTYSVVVENDNGCTQGSSIYITVKEDYKSVQANNILTPNGDGVNDTWVVANIDAYPDAKVQIFDREGRTIYLTKNYDNSWNGTFNGQALAEGTYYYIIDYGNRPYLVKGYITIIRERK